MYPFEASYANKNELKAFVGVGVGVAVLLTVILGVKLGVGVVVLLTVMLGVLVGVWLGVGGMHDVLLASNPDPALVL